MNDTIWNGKRGRGCEGALGRLNKRTKNSPLMPSLLMMMGELISQFMENIAHCIGVSTFPHPVVLNNGNIMVVFARSEFYNGKS